MASPSKLASNSTRALVPRSSYSLDPSTLDTSLTIAPTLRPSIAIIKLIK
jgi:hypothetical protein